MDVYKKIWSCRNKKKMHACCIHHEVKSVCPSDEYVHVTQCKCNFLKNFIPSYIYNITLLICWGPSAYNAIQCLQFGQKMSKILFEFVVHHESFESPDISEHFIQISCTEARRDNYTFWPSVAGSKLWVLGIKTVCSCKKWVVWRRKLQFCARHMWPRLRNCLNAAWTVLGVSHTQTHLRTLNKYYIVD
jgi:hypothetical protein